MGRVDRVDRVVLPLTLSVAQRMLVSEEQADEEQERAACSVAAVRGGWERVR